MPIQYKPSKHAFFTEGDSLTEQEYKNSCDINLMIKNALRGIDVPGGGPMNYGYDDLTIDPVQFRIQKQKLEDDLSVAAKTQEFSEAELQAIPTAVKEKFNFRKKQETKAAKKNDDQTTQKQPAQDPASTAKPDPS